MVLFLFLVAAGRQLTVKRALSLDLLFTPWARLGIKRLRQEEEKIRAALERDRKIPAAHEGDLLLLPKT